MIACPFPKEKVNFGGILGANRGKTPKDYYHITTGLSAPISLPYPNIILIIS